MRHMDFTSKDERDMKPKVLIHVSGGIAEYVCLGDVDVEVVDEDNIDAGDPPVQLDH